MLASVSSGSLSPVSQSGGRTEGCTRDGSLTLRGLQQLAEPKAWWWAVLVLRARKKKKKKSSLLDRWQRKGCIWKTFEDSPRVTVRWRKTSQRLLLRELTHNCQMEGCSDTEVPYWHVLPCEQCSDTDLRSAVLLLSRYVKDLKSVSMPNRGQSSENTIQIFTRKCAPEIESTMLLN